MDSNKSHNFKSVHFKDMDPTRI